MAGPGQVDSLVRAALSDPSKYPLELKSWIQKIVSGNQDIQLNTRQLPLTQLSGAPIGYDQIVSSVNVTGILETSQTIIIPGSEYEFDGSPIWAEFFTPQASPPQVGSQALIVCLFEDGAEVGRWGDIRNPTGGNVGAWPQLLRYRFTPTPGQHQFSIRAFASSTTGTPAIQAGSGGVGNDLPAYLSLTRA